MAYLVDIQNARPDPLPFSEDDIITWVELALSNSIPSAELSIRFVEIDEISDLNYRYRKKIGPTNVLSFPSEIPEEIMKEFDYPYIGDIIVCPDVLTQESTEQLIPVKHHFAHIIIHGVLHLLGHDHMKPDEETIMQKIEITLLKQLGIDNPYE
jgi:probable rRNA maturation factor